MQGIQTPYGAVLHVGNKGYLIDANDAQLYAWANKPGAWWPCSELVELNTISVALEGNGDLVELVTDPDGIDIPGDELNAWIEDTITEYHKMPV